MKNYIPLVDHDYTGFILGTAIMAAAVIVAAVIFAMVRHYQDKDQMTKSTARLCYASLAVGVIGFITFGIIMVTQNIQQLSAAEDANLSAIKHNVSTKYNVTPENVNYAHPDSRFANGAGTFTLNIRAENYTQADLNVEFTETGEPYMWLDPENGATATWLDTMVRD
jgi:hypothetical protein